MAFEILVEGRPRAGFGIDPVPVQRTAAANRGDECLAIIVLRLPNDNATFNFCVQWIVPAAKRSRHL
jgi:hypothetical protein